MSLLPETAMVGLITFGTMVQVHELGFTECPKSYVFKGTKDYEPQQVQELLGLSRGVVGAAPVPGMAGSAAAAAAASNRFLLPVSECSTVLESILEDLQRDPVSDYHTPARYRTSAQK